MSKCEHIMMWTTTATWKLHEKKFKLHGDGWMAKKDKAKHTRRRNLKVYFTSSSSWLDTILNGMNEEKKCILKHTGDVAQCCVNFECNCVKEIWCCFWIWNNIFFSLSEC